MNWILIFFSFFVIKLVIKNGKTILTFSSSYLFMLWSYYRTFWASDSRQILILFSMKVRIANMLSVESMKVAKRRNCCFITMERRFRERSVWNSSIHNAIGIFKCIWNQELAELAMFISNPSGSGRSDSYPFDFLHAILLSVFADIHFGSVFFSSVVCIGQCNFEEARDKTGTPRNKNWIDRWENESEFSHNFSV